MVCDLLLAMGQVEMIPTEQKRTSRALVPGSLLLAVRQRRLKNLSGSE
jgi:hypothetical protein